MPPRLGASVALLLLLWAADWAPLARAATPCDGVHDATAALNAALAAGGQVRLPAGTCLISGSLRIVSNSVISGAGIGRTIVKASPAPAYAVIEIGSARAGANHVDLSGLTVDGSGTGMLGRPQDGVLSYAGSFDLRIHGIEVFRAGGNGIRIFGHDTEVSDDVVHDNFANGIFAVGDQWSGPVVPTTDVRVLRNRVVHNSLAGLPPNRSWDGIDIDSATANCLVAGNTLVGNDIILWESTRFAASSHGHQVLDNTILDSPENGIDVSGTNLDFKLIGNRIERTRGFGILVNGPAARGMIRGNTILGTTNAGILIDNWVHQPGSPSAITITGNTVDPEASAGRSPALVLRAGATDIRVLDNRFGSHGIDTTRAGAAIVLQGNR